MNFFKDKELALRFKNNEVPSKERFWYLLIYLTLQSSWLLMPRHHTSWEMYANILSLLTVIVSPDFRLKFSKPGLKRDNNWIF
jgi:hypothetical protein